MNCRMDVAPGTVGEGLRAAAPIGWEGRGAPSSFELRSRNQSLVKLVGRPVPRLSSQAVRSHPKPQAGAGWGAVAAS